MTTVGSLFREKLSIHGRIAAGDGGLANNATWAVTARARTPALDTLQGGEIVLLPPSAMQYLGGDEALASLIPGFRDAGASGICIWFQPDEAAIQVAEGTAIPIISIGDATPAEVEREVLDQIAGQMRTRLRQQDDRQTYLLDTLAANRGLEAIIRVLADTVGHPVTYLSVSGEPISSSHAAYIPCRGFWESVSDEQTVVALPAEATSPGAWVTPVLRNSTRLGALVVVGPSAPAPQTESLVMRQTAVAIAVEAGRLEAVAQAEQRLRREFYTDLFGGRSPETLYSRARSLGISLPTEAVVAVVGSADGSRALPEAVKDRVQGLLTRQPAYPVLDRGEELLMMLPLTLRGENTAGLLVRSLAPLTSSAAVGISDIVEEISRLPDASQEANTALLVSRRLRNGAPTRFSDTGAYGLLAPLSKTSVGRHVIEQVLGPLSRYDDEHNPALTATLETYIACNGNASLTAQTLNLHRNSLAYRLRRIEKLTGLPLADSENRLLLALALRLRVLL